MNFGGVNSIKNAPNNFRRGRYKNTGERILEKNYFKNKSLALIYIIFTIAAIGDAVFFTVTENMTGAICSALTVLIFSVPYFLFLIFKVRLPLFIEISYLIFAFSAEALGSGHGFYTVFPWWDVYLHTFWGFICAGIGFTVFSECMSRRGSHNSPVLLHSGFAFCFSLSTSVIWEFLEFSADTFFGMDVQKDTLLSEIHSTLITADGSVGTVQNITGVSVNGEPLISGGYLDIGLFDTVEDMFVGFVGAFIFAVAAAIYLKNKRKKSQSISN